MAFNAPVSPVPEMRPMRAHVSSTAFMSGRVMTAIHSDAVAEHGPRHRVGGDAGRIIVGCASDEPRPQQAKV